MNLKQFFLIMVGAPWLGHGRRWEAFAAIVSLTFGAVYTFNNDATLDSKATVLLAWQGLDFLPGLMFSMSGFLSTYGLLANIKAWPGSRPCRFVGAAINLFIMLWYVLTFCWIGAPFATGSIIFFWMAVFSLGTMTMALANLPKPGNAGVL